MGALEEGIDIHSMTRFQIESRLEKMCWEADPKGSDVEYIRRILEHLSGSPKIAYTPVATFIQHNARSYMFMSDLKEIPKKAPHKVYDFLNARAAEVRHTFQIKDAAKALKMLMAGKNLRRLAYALFTGDHRRTVGINDVKAHVEKGVE